MAQLAMLVVAVIAVAAVFLALRVDGRFRRHRSEDGADDDFPIELPRTRDLDQ